MNFREEAENTQSDSVDGSGNVSVDGAQLESRPPPQSSSSPSSEANNRATEVTHEQPSAETYNEAPSMSHTGKVIVYLFRPIDW